MNKKLIGFGVALVIIVVGIIMVCTLGFNLGLDYGEYTRIYLYMTEPTSLDDVKDTVGEVFDGKFKVEYSDEFKGTVSIKAKDMSDDELEQVKGKLTEKYNFEEDAGNITVMNVPSVRVFDLVKDYIKPFAISFIVVLVYFAIAFRKLGIYKSIIEPAISTVLIGGVYVSLLAICRIPINEYIVPLGVLIYIITLLGFTVYLNGLNKNKAQ